MLNKEGKLFGKISIIDIIVILAIAVLAFGVYIRFISPSATKVVTSKQKIEYTIEIKEVRIGSVEALKKGGEVIDTTINQSAGKIVDVIYENAVNTRIFNDGTISQTNIPERYNVKVKIQVDGKKGEAGYFTSTNQSLLIGGPLYFKTKYAVSAGTIIDIKEVTK